MRLKMNKACDLNSLSVLPPHSRRTNAIRTGSELSSNFSKAQASQASQLRNSVSVVQPALSQSQQSFSQALPLSQLSQSSLEDIFTNEQKFGSQERDNSIKRMSCLAPVGYTREDSSQLPVTRSSNNGLRRWNSATIPDHKCQTSEELEHRIGMIDTALNRLMMVLDSIQSDIMQVNRTVKDVSLETEGIKQKMVAHDSSLQLMLKGEEDIKATLDVSLKSLPGQLRRESGDCKPQEIVSVLSVTLDQIEERLKSLPDQLRKESSQLKLQEIVSVLSAMPDQIEERLKFLPDQLRNESGKLRLQEVISMLSTMPDQIEMRFLKLKDELCWAFTKQMEAMTHRAMPPSDDHSLASVQPRKAKGNKRLPLKENRAAQPRKAKGNKRLPLKENRAVQPRKKACKAGRGQPRKSQPPMIVDQPSASKILPARRSCRAEAKKLMPLKLEDKVEHGKEVIPCSKQETGPWITIDSDEEINGGFAVLFGEKEAAAGNCSKEEMDEETMRILVKARRRRRYHISSHKNRENAAVVLL